MWWFLYSDLDHHLPLLPPFVPLPPPVLFFHAASECICPACMKTVWGWSCCPRGSTCWRSPRRSSSAWRRWSSSVSVSLPPPVWNIRTSSQQVKYGCSRMQPWWEGYCLRELLLCSGFVVAVPVEGPRSQRCFDELRTSYIKELDRLASHYGETTRRQRLFQLTQLLDYLQSVTDTILPHTWRHDASINRNINVILDRTTEHRCGSSKVS